MLSGKKIVTYTNVSGISILQDNFKTVIFETDVPHSYSKSVFAHFLRGNGEDGNP